MTLDERLSELDETYKTLRRELETTRDRRERIEDL
jgi:hypothetical protein